MACWRAWAAAWGFPAARSRSCRMFHVFHGSAAWPKGSSHSMAHSRPRVTATTHELPFDKLSPRDFERLCLWLVEREGYERAEHLGAAGSEQGRDVIAWRGDRQWAFQCKRVRRFGPQDVLEKVEKLLALPEDQRPVGVVLLVTCDVSAAA